MGYNCAYISCKVKHKYLNTKQTLWRSMHLGCVQMQEWKLPYVKKKEWWYMQQIFIHQYLFILLSPCLTNSKRRYFYQFKQYRHRINASLFQLRKGAGAAPYSNVIFWVKLSCVTHFKPLISAYWTTVGQTTLSNILWTTALAWEHTLRVQWSDAVFFSGFQQRTSAWMCHLQSKHYNMVLTKF